MKIFDFIRSSTPGISIVDACYKYWIINGKIREIQLLKNSEMLDSALLTSLGNKLGATLMHFTYIINCGATIQLFLSGIFLALDREKKDETQKDRKFTLMEKTALFTFISAMITGLISIATFSICDYKLNKLWHEVGVH
ncbi:MAG: hypothetical protein L0207_07090 [Chlamydiae bacterium]|nr:hypothetical protein [Chlamydiota bacterium]